MRAIVCCPIQYLTALGIANQSAGYLPNAEYISAQMKRKTSPAVTSGTNRLRVHANVEERAAGNPARRGLPRAARSARVHKPNATNRTPVMYAFSFVTPASPKETAAAVSQRARSVSRKRRKQTIVPS